MRIKSKQGKIRKLDSQVGTNEKYYNKKIASKVVGTLLRTFRGGKTTVKKMKNQPPGNVTCTE